MRYLYGWKHFELRGPKGRLVQEFALACGIGEDRAVLFRLGTNTLGLRGGSKAQCMCGLWQLSGVHKGQGSWDKNMVLSWVPQTFNCQNHLRCRSP